MYRKIVTLKNGKRVANFSSPHAFTFEDGSVIPALNEEIAKRLTMDVEEDVLNEKGGY